MTAIITPKGTPPATPANAPAPAARIIPRIDCDGEEEIVGGAGVSEMGLGAETLSEADEEAIVVKVDLVREDVETSKGAEFMVLGHVE